MVYMTFVTEYGSLFVFSVISYAFESMIHEWVFLSLYSCFKIIKSCLIASLVFSNIYLHQMVIITLALSHISIHHIKQM